MKKLLKKIVLMLKKWEQQTDAEFMAMSEIRKKEIMEFINRSTY